MGVGRDSLVSQAVFTLARLNGYVIPGKVVLGAGHSLSSTNNPVGNGGIASKPAKGAARAKGRPQPEPEPEPEVPEEEQGNPFEQQEQQDEEPPPDEEPQEEPQADEEPPPEEEEPPPPPRKGGGGALTVVMAGREPYKLSADSMLIGRGKHCDFVIESNRVSREHARISKEGSEFILEDLNSSNGTFFGAAKEKVTRPRKIKDGDEYTFGTEKVKLRIGR
jgi:hypothetical protein